MDGVPLKDRRTSLIACGCFLMETNPTIDLMAQL